MTIVFFPFVSNGVIYCLLTAIRRISADRWFDATLADGLLVAFFVFQMVIVAAVELSNRELKLPRFERKAIAPFVGIISIAIVVLYWIFNSDALVAAFANPRMYYASTRLNGGLLYYVIIPISIFVYYCYMSRIDFSKGKQIAAGLIATLLIIAYLYLFGQKSTILVVAFLLITTICFKEGERRNVLIVACGGMLVVVALVIFAAYSRQQGIPVENIIASLAGYSDYLDNFSLLVENLDHHYFGAIFLQDEFYSYIPRFLWPEKPTLFGSLALGLEVPELVEWTMAMTGAPSFGPLGQAYADFGVFGIVFSLLLTWAFALVARTYEIRLEREGFNSFNHLIFLAFCGVKIFSITLVTIPLYQVAVVALVYALTTKFEKA